MNDRARPPRRPPATDAAPPSASPPGNAIGGAPNDAPTTRAPGHAIPAGGDLADWLGRALLADPGADAWRDGAFVDWLAAEARAADRPSRRQGDTAFLARGRALLARAHARQLGVLRFPGLPEDAAGPSAAPSAAPRRVREGRPESGVLAWRRRVPVVELGVAAGPGRDLWDEPPERWIALPDFVPDARYLALRVVGTSMTPLLASGDVVLVRADARGREARAGRVVVARHPDDGYVCKRVERAGARELVLASLEPGHGTLHLPADPALVVGTVVAAWPGR